MLKRNKRITTSMTLVMIIISTIATTAKAVDEDRIKSTLTGCESVLRLAKDRDIDSFIKVKDSYNIAINKGKITKILLNAKICSVSEDIVNGNTYKLDKKIIRHKEMFNEAKANGEIKCNEIKKAENIIKQIEAKDSNALKITLEMLSRIIASDNICSYKPICKPNCVKPTVVKPIKEVKPVIKPVEEVKPTVVKPIVNPVEEVKPTVIKPVDEMVEIVKPEVTVNKEEIKAIEEIKVVEKVQPLIKNDDNSKVLETNNSVSNKKQGELVKTGSNIYTSLLTQVAATLSVAGAFLVKKFRK